MSAEQHESHSAVGSSKAGESQRLIVICREPECGVSCSRLQELWRHIQSFHLPYSIFCPYPNCPSKWRGDRVDALVKHLNKQKCGEKPEKDQYQIYDVDLVLDIIKEGRESTSIAARYGVDFVKERAIELGREDWMKDPWGHGDEKRARRLRNESRK